MLSKMGSFQSKIRAEVYSMQGKMNANQDGRWTRVEESRDGFYRLQDRCQPRNDEGHVGGMCKKKAKVKSEKTKAVLEEMEVAVDVFEERLAKMDTKVSEATDAVVEQQEVRNEKMNVDTIWAFENQYGCRRLAVRCLRQPKKLATEQWWVPQTSQAQPSKRLNYNAPVGYSERRFSWMEQCELCTQYQETTTHQPKLRSFVAGQ
jgi:hypothetical protein